MPCFILQNILANIFYNFKKNSIGVLFVTIFVKIDISIVQNRSSIVRYRTKVVQNRSKFAFLVTIFV